jgi:YHS domain-containing protein
MVRFTLFILLLLVLAASLSRLVKEIFIQRRKLNRPTEAEELVQDPCCQTYIPAGTAVRKRVAGRNYYFCSKDCMRKFLDEKKSQNSKVRVQRLKP